MKISKDEVLRVAELARLELKQDEVMTLSEKIGKVLEYIALLNQVDTTGIFPTTHAIDLNNAFREDKEGEHLEQKDVFSNAPESENGHFAVPKIIKI
ncbi:MAG: Asp-tRNA(Asn)/Glu-tRNA(Gln) amidotransferase subunit GatC [Thermodesulfobacteriota bacterium]